MIVIVIILHLLCTNHDSIRPSGRQGPNGENRPSDICRSDGLQSPAKTRGGLGPSGDRDRDAATGNRRLNASFPPRGSMEAGSRQRKRHYGQLSRLTSAGFGPRCVRRTDADTHRRVAYHQAQRERCIQ